jgi:hypothetical protein
MGIYNDFYVFVNHRVIPVAQFSIYNRNIGGFFRDNLRDFQPNEEYIIDGSLVARLLQAYEDGTLARSPLVNPRDPLIFPDEVMQLCQIKKYIDDKYKVIYTQID